MRHAGSPFSIATGPQLCLPEKAYGMTVSATGSFHSCFHSYKPGAAMAAESLASIQYAAASELTVTHVAAADDARTVLTETTDYVLGGDGLGGSGTITATAAWPADDLFEIQRLTERTQLRSFPSFEPVSPRSAEKAWDKVTRIAQEQDAAIAAAQGDASEALAVLAAMAEVPGDAGSAAGAIAARVAAESARDIAVAAAATTGANASTAVSAAERAEAAAALMQAQGNITAYATWALLEPVNAADNALAIIYTDGGTHVDPVLGGAPVSNSGIFQFVLGSSAWKRIGSTQAALAAASAALANGWARQLAEDGVYSEAFLDNVAPTAINLTDGAAITFTATNNASNLEIDLVTAARTVLISTLNKVPVEQRITLRCEVVAGASAGNAVGIAFYANAGDFSAFFYQANGWFRQHDQAGLSSLALTLDPWAAGAVIDYVVDVFADGTARISVSLNGGKTWHFGGLTSVPLGPIKLVVADTMTVRFSMTQAALPAHVSSKIANDIGGQPGSRPYEGLLKAARLTPPAGLDAALTAELGVCRLDGTRAFSDLSLASQLSVQDPRVSVIYVDVGAGNDANPGTAAAPIKRLSTALQRCFGGKVKVLAKGGTYQGLSSFNQVVVTSIDQLEVVSSDGQPVISSCHQTIAWTLDIGATYFGTFSNVFYSAFDAGIVDGNGDFARLAPAADLAACRATAGTYWITGTTIYIHLADGRVPDSAVRIFTGVGGGGTGNFYYKKAGGQVYLENVELHGGYYGAYVLAEIAAPLTYFRHRGCGFKYALTNGLATQGRILAVGQESAAPWNTEDGLVYHHYSAPLGIPLAIEVDCRATSNGWNAIGTNNGSTNHDGGHTVRVNGEYSNNQNRQIHDVNGSISWMVGSAVTAPRAGAAANYSFGLVGYAASIAYLDGCTSLGGTALETLGVGSTIYTANFTADSGNAPGANVLPYTP